MLFAPAHFTYWIFLIIGIALFLLVIFSGGGEEDAEGELGDLPVFSFFGFGQAPLFLLLATDFSLWGLSGWLLNTAVGQLTGSLPENFWGWSGIVFLISLAFSLFVGSFIARSLGKIFAPFGEDASSERLLGCIGVVFSRNLPSAADRKIGQINVRDPAGNLLKVNACIPEWAESTPNRGQEVLVIDQQESTYFVVVKDSLDHQRWLANSEDLGNST
jgi:hypothetical protein